MCGIVGLLVKKSELRESLGELMVPMLIGMSDRGPDSAGLAVFSEPVKEFGASEMGQYTNRKYSLYSGQHCLNWTEFSQCLQPLGNAKIKAKNNHAILISDIDSDQIKQFIGQHYPQSHILSIGRSIDLYKDAGKPADVIDRYQFRSLRGTHLVGHTRMATESAVTPAHAHPFTAGEDFCLVHNGSLSNSYSIRRQLEPQGIRFETDNDTEAACRFLEWRMREGDDLETALQKGFEELDGFYTFLMGTKDKLALVRDAFACKPAVVAETDDYVAIASEFRSLAHLPNIKNASIYEPAPEEIYVWTV
jgi:glutamate synthase domain-containing protein 1